MVIYEVDNDYDNESYLEGGLMFSLGSEYRALIPVKVCGGNYLQVLASTGEYLQLLASTWRYSQVLAATGEYLQVLASTGK